MTLPGFLSCIASPIRGEEFFYILGAFFLNPRGAFLFYDLGAFLWFVKSDVFKKRQTGRPEGAIAKKTVYL